MVILILCCTQDPASTNISARLLELENWDLELKTSSIQMYRAKDFTLINQPQELSRADQLRDLILSQNPQLVIFGSRHESISKKPMLTLHFPGELGIGLSSPAPGAARFLLDRLRQTQLGCILESTHHGPHNLEIPCLFLEIGSEIGSWKDPKLGEQVALSILELGGTKYPELPVVLGVGGGHYLPRQNMLMAQTWIAFGHCFASYMLDRLDLDWMRRASIISQARYLYLDRKSMDSSTRARIQKMASELGLEILGESQLKSRFGCPC